MKQMECDGVTISATDDNNPDPVAYEQQVVDHNDYKSEIVNDTISNNLNNLQIIGISMMV